MQADFDITQEKQEKEARRNGIIAIIVFPLLLLIALLYFMAWTAPDPPLPKYGIEVNFGFEGTEGSSNIQNKTKPSDSESFEKAKPNPDPTPKPLDKTEPTPTPVKEEIKNPVEKPTKIVPVTDEAEKAVEAPKKEETKKEEPKKVEKTGGGPADNDGKADEDIKNNDGNKKDGVGDKGKEDGKLDADALVGGGSGGGATLSLEGWKWDTPPNEKDASSETGTVTIKFKIDSDGLVVSSQVYNRTVSFTTAEFYKKLVDKMTFTPNNTGGRVANFTIGSVTFVLEDK